MTDHPERPTADEPEDTNTDDATPEPQVIDAQGLVTRLVGAGIIQEDENIDDLRLTDEFREDWWEQIEGFHDEERARREMAAITDIDSEKVKVEETDDGRLVVSYEETELGEWHSRAAFISDLALRPTIAAWLPLWESLDPISRGGLLARIRAFLETCPSCEGTLEIEERANAEIGQGSVSIACVDCGQVIVSSEL